MGITSFSLTHPPVNDMATALQMINIMILIIISL